ncbi:MAG: hypothetical protein E4H09_04810 [Spirochaetales bacterium]|nr:MAG: hypothetical protein E4H09_04810 [Spirochaetales bacterium]
MRRLLVLIAVLLLPAAAFAQLQIGGTGLYNYPIMTPGATDEIDISNFTFGADARLKILFFQVSALGLVTPGSDTLGTPTSIDLVIDGGISFDLLLFRVGLGVGPNLRIDLGEGTDPVGYGLNVKATADVMLGGLSVGLTYLNKFELDFSQAEELLDQDYSTGLLGVSLLFSL